MVDGDDVLTLARCYVCGVALLVDPAIPPPILHHLPDGAHRLIPVPSPSGPGPGQAWPEGILVRAGVLGVAVRLRELADDLDDVLAAMSGGDHRA